MKFLVVLLLISLCLLGCTSRNKEESDQLSTNETIANDSIEHSNLVRLQEINDSAVSIINSSYMHEGYPHKRDSLLNEATKLLRNCTQLSPKYLPCHTNLANVFMSQGEYNNAIQILENFLKSTKRNYPETAFLVALLYDKTGNARRASHGYHAVIEQYEVNADIDVNSEIGVLYVRLFVEDKDLVLQKLEEISINDQNEEEILMMKKFIQEFDKKEYLESI